MEQKMKDIEQWYKAEMLETDKVGYLSVHYILQLSPKRLELSEYNFNEDIG